MKFNPPRAVRAVLYLSAMFATPTVSYLAATDRISDSLTVLLTAYIALVMGLAVANTATSEPTLPRVSGGDNPDDWTGGAEVKASGNKRTGNPPRP